MLTRLRHRWAWLCLVLLSLASGSFAQAPNPHTLGSTPAPDQEPITPIPQPPGADKLKLVLGERLFGDRRLSHDGTLACSSCHDTHANGAAADGRRTTVRDRSKLPFNIPTVFNAALSFRLNWEGTFRTLEEQAKSSLESPAAMGTSVDEVLKKLDADRQVVDQFSDAYGRAPDRASLLDAIAYTNDLC
jgi:cytochrome c peroxidase